MKFYIDIFHRYSERIKKVDKGFWEISLSTTERFACVIMKTLLHHKINQNNTLDLPAGQTFLQQVAGDDFSPPVFQ